MSFHNKPNYQIPELIEALKAHRLPHDTPSQLADSFRIGWMACRELAQADSVTAPAGVVGPDGMMRDELRSMIEGMSVSVDVSTGDHDAGHRYFGTVTEVMECQGNKHGVTLLVQDAEPNFTATPTAPSTPSSTAQQASAHVLNLVQDAFAEVAMAYPKAFALHKVGLADTAVRKALAAYTPQAADSVPAVSDLPPLPAPDLRDVGTKPQEIKEFLKGYATEYARTAIAARAPADNELEDAARYRWLRDQAHPDSEDSGIAVSESDFNDWGNKFTRYYSGEELDAAVDAARAADSGVQEDAARESEYRRGYRHGYEQRDAEVRGAMA